jgi:excisionase family DNA binding protein
MVLSVRQVAALLGCSEQAMDKLVYRRRLPYRKLGGRVIFLKRELEQFLEQLLGLTMGRSSNGLMEEKAELVL